MDHSQEVGIPQGCSGDDVGCRCPEQEGKLEVSWRKLSTSLLCNHESLPEDRESSMCRCRMKAYTSQIMLNT